MWSSGRSLLLLLVALNVWCACGLKLLRLNVPPYKLSGEKALLQCLYDLEYDILYSVKWYKDDEEFYRYVPRSNPVQHSYRLDGIRVDHSSSDAQQVVLYNVSLKSSGTYRCEVSAEAPSFASAQGEGHMEVIVLPREGPYISGEERLYLVDDEISLNCTSGKSYPASELRWYINDQQVPVDDPRLERYPLEQHPQGLLSSSLGLRFTVSSSHLASGSMRLRCIAEVAPVLWKGDSESFVLKGTPPPDTVREALFLVRGSSGRPGAATVALLASLLVSAVT